MTASIAEDPRAHARAEAGKDAVVVVHLLSQGRLDDVNSFLATIEPHEMGNLLIAFGGLAAALMQELDSALIRHGEPPMSGTWMAQLANG